MYGTSAQYGWSSNPGVRTSDIVELPLAPVKRQSSGNGMCCRTNWHTFGIHLSLLAAASLALGVADVVVTYQTYMVGWSCSSSTSNAICNPNNLIWTWIGVGIWASIPVFIVGILAIRKGSNPSLQNCWFELLLFLSAFVFTPAMVVISALEVYKGATIYYWKYSSPLTADDLAKAIIPIVIAVLGFIEHIKTAMAVWELCCCGARTETTAVEVVRAAPVLRTTNIAQSNSCPQTSTAVYSSGARGPSFPGAFYASSPGQSATTYNYFSGMKQSGGNPAYNYFRG